VTRRHVADAAVLEAAIELEGVHARYAEDEIDTIGFEQANAGDAGRGAGCGHGGAGPRRVGRAWRSGGTLARFSEPLQPLRRNPTMAEKTIRCRPLTAGRWSDLERVFGPNGANSGCWCMWFRRPRR